MAALLVGDTAPDAVYLGDTPVDRVYRGGTLLWPPAPSGVDLYNEGAGEDDWVPGYSTGSGSQSKEADHLALTITAFGSTRTWVTDELVDLTDVDTVEVDWSAEEFGTELLVVSTSKTANYTTYDARHSSSGPFSRQIDTLDVSGLSGEFYIRAHSTSNGSTLRIYRVTLKE